ncbi:MAG TPA: glutamyl-tRNA reductase [bacterium]|nr:glutamyl-tRNA reductase [bacterium]HPO08604.1 glutamyl-tRNA reductase [bacterium]
MHLVLIGLSHKTAPIAVRERVAFTPEDQETALLQLRKHEDVEECMILSTCNRTEVLTVFRDGCISTDLPVRFLSKQKNIRIEELQEHIYTFTNADAVEHLFRVCAGLDSMVVGETQIASQVKDAYSMSCSCRCNGRLLNRLLHCAFAVSKRVRTSTDISKGSLSVSFSACDLIQKILGDLKEKIALLIGTGETGRLVARDLAERGIGGLRITNRTFHRAQELAGELGAEAFPFDHLEEQINQADVLVSATMADTHILTRTDLEKVVSSRSNPLVCMDLGVPRDLDPRIGQLPNVRLYNIDDLQDLVEENRRKRHEEIHKGYAIVQEERENFVEWFRTHRAAPTIEELQKMLEQIRAAEMEPLRTALQSKDYEMVDLATKSLMRKILQHPILHLKEAAKQDDSVVQIRLIGDILGIHDD